MKWTDEQEKIFQEYTKKYESFIRENPDHRLWEGPDSEYTNLKDQLFKMAAKRMLANKIKDKK